MMPGDALDRGVPAEGDTDMSYPGAEPQPRPITDESSMGESLRAQLLATLDLMPTLAWYATPSGGLTYVNEGGAEYLGLSREHPLRSRTDTDAVWDSHLEWIHPDDHD